MLRSAARSVALEQQLRDIVATSQDWIWEHDRDGKFTFCSDSVRAILGYAPEEILGTNASQYVHPEDLAGARFRHAYARARTSARRRNLQARWRHRNGSYRWLERNMLVLLGDERPGDRRSAAASAISPNAAARRNTSAA